MPDSLASIFQSLSDLGVNEKTAHDYLLPPPAQPTDPAASRILTWIERAARSAGRFRTNDGRTIQFGPQHELPVNEYGDMRGILVALGLGEDDPGVYAVIDRRSDRVLYFGQAKAMTQRATSSHEHFGDWCREADGAANLRLAFYHMPNSSESERVDVESSLIEFHKPPCNVQFNPFAEYLRGLTNGRR